MKPSAVPQTAPHAPRNLPLVLVLGGIVTAIVIAIAAGQKPWDALFINPLINILVLFNNIFFDDFGVAIILFTLVMRLVTLPLTVRQFQSTKAMSAIQPRMQELQKKYKDPKRRQEETLKLYREAGVNPLGCLFPMLIQMPIWIALYRALGIIVGGTPESLLSLAHRLYPWSYLNEAVPLEHRFLWLDLGRPDTTFILPLLVGVTTYIQQKLTTTSATATTPQQQQMTSMMNWMMPLMFVWFTLSVPSGLGLYWMISNVTSVFISFLVYGRRFSWRQMLPLPQPATQPRRPTPPREPERRVKATVPISPGPEKGLENEKRRGRRRGRRKDR